MTYEAAQNCEKPKKLNTVIIIITVFTKNNFLVLEYSMANLNCIKCRIEKVILLIYAKLLAIY